MHIRKQPDVTTNWPEKAGLCTLTFLATFFVILGFATPSWFEILAKFDQYYEHGKHIYVGLWGVNECNTTLNKIAKPIQTNCTYIYGVWLQDRFWFQFTQGSACLAVTTSILSTMTMFIGTAINLLIFRKITIILLLFTDVGNIMALLIFRNIYTDNNERTNIFISVSVMCLAFGICFTSIAMLFNIWLLKR